MGRKEEAPAAPTYVEPKPPTDLMPDSNVLSYKTLLGDKLNNFDSWYDPIQGQRKTAFQDNLTQSVNDTYEPIMRNAREDINRRLGGIQNTIFTDKINDIEKTRGDYITKAMNDYILGEEQTRQAAQASLLDQLSAITNLQSNAHTMGLNYAAPLNNFNLQNYQNQLGAYQLQQQKEQQSMSNWMNLAKMAAGVGLMFVPGGQVAGTAMLGSGAGGTL